MTVVSSSHWANPGRRNNSDKSEDLLPQTDIRTCGITGCSGQTVKDPAYAVARLSLTRYFNITAGANKAPAFFIRTSKKEKICI